MTDDEKADGKRTSLPAVLDQRISGNIARRFGIIPVADEGDTTVFVSKGEMGDDQITILRIRLGKMKFRLARPDEFLEHRAKFDQLLERFPEFPAGLNISSSDDSKPKRR